MEIENLLERAIVPNWRMPYAENFNKPHTNTLPTFAGFHRNLGSRDDTVFHGGFTLRYEDGFYGMIPSIRKKGVIPYDKLGRIRLRCQHRGCHAKGLIRCTVESLITDLNYKALRADPDLWQVVANCGGAHTCNKKVPYFYSDRRNFGEDYRDYQTEYGDGTKVPWDRACTDWTSGFGSGYDGIIHGSKLDHGRKVSLDRAKDTPTNKYAATPQELIVPDKNKYIETTVMFGENNFPKKINQDFYRQTDRFGNMYFLSSADSELLFSHDSWFCDATYSPIKGSKLFVQLFIISVRINISENTIMAFPVAWVLMIGKSHQQYDELFKTIKSLAQADINKLNNGPQVDISPLFIYADAELAIRSAGQNQFPTAEHRICLFHVLQAWRRNLVQYAGFKTKLESGLDCDQEIRDFWDFVAGIPNTNLYILDIRSKVILELENFQNILTFDSNIQKENFIKFLNYLIEFYLSDTARYPYGDWEQYSVIQGGNAISRTNNISEAINSSLNSRFRGGKFSFNTTIARIHKFKIEKNKDLAALQPKPFYNFPTKPSKKDPIKKVDLVVLSQLSNFVELFNFSPIDLQLRTLKTHLIKIGGLRRAYYKGRRILYVDQTTLNMSET